MKKLGTLQQICAEEPYCHLCGDIMSGTADSSDDITSSEQIFTERTEWSDMAQREGYVYGKPEELNNIYFKIPWIWNRIYRGSKQRYLIYLAANR